MRPVSVEIAKAEALEGYRAEGQSHLNCAQTVLSFSLRLLSEDKDLLLLAHYLGGGVGRTGQVCGVLSGAALSLGARDYHLRAPERPSATTEELQTIIDDFEKEFGAVTCAALTGHDLRSKASLHAFKKTELSQRCVVYICWICDRLTPLLTPHLPGARD
jgi:C_GCAxxG_C_C family probable redox protein